MSTLFRLLFIQILLGATLMLSAQPVKRDSLLTELKHAEGKQKYDILIELSDACEDFDETVKYAYRAIEQASLLDAKSLADAQLNLAQIYSDGYEDSKALATFSEALKTSLKNNYSEGTLNSYDGVMRSYFYLDSIDKTKEFAYLLINEAEKVGSLKYKSYAYLQLARVLQGEGNVDSSLKLTYKTLELREQLGDKIDIAQTYKFLGQIYHNDARFEPAIDCYNKEIEIKEEIRYDSRSLAISYQNLGNTHFAIGNYQIALEKNQKALSLFEEVNFPEGIAICCTGIGDIYQNLSQSELETEQNEANFSKALDYYKRALDIFSKLDDIDNKEVVLQSIGTVNSRIATNSFVARFGEDWEDSLYTLSSGEIKNKFQTSLNYYELALEICTQRGKNRRIIRDVININTNIGSIYNWCRDWQVARRHIISAINQADANDFSLEKTSAYYALAENYMGNEQLDLAENQLIKCITLSQELGLKETLRYCYSKLSQIYEYTNKPEKSLLYYKKAVKIKDEIFTEKNQRSINEIQTIYETDRKEHENKLLRNEKALQDSMIQKQRYFLFGVIFVSILILLVALLLFKMFRNKQHANHILQEKNDLITEQKTQITDSIRYASSIQHAVLPTKQFFNELVPQHFVLLLPKDIVSGDFYWITRVGGKVVIVAADCTGHGVPGAFMSMLGISFLFEIVNKDGVLCPSEILNNLRNLIKTTLGQKDEMSQQKDGMDISLCVIDYQNMSLEWAGAYNPLYQVRDGQLTEYVADKMPVAVHIKDYMPFTNHTIELKKGDTFYIFSDGYADQFGGSEGRKFMSKRMKEFLVSINNEPIEVQGELLRQEHLSWKKGYEQIDDILVIGFRV